MIDDTALRRRNKTSPNARWTNWSGNLSKGAWILVSVVVVLLPIVNAQRLWVAAAILTMIYVPAAVGQNLIVGNAGQLAMGQAAFVATGAYTAGFLALHFHLDGTVCILASALVSGLAGALVGFPALRISGDYLFIVSLGFNLIVLDIALQWQPVTGGASGLIGIPQLTVFGVDLGFGRLFYYAVLACAVICCTLTWVITSSRLGRVVEALRDDEIAAAACGVNAVKPRVSTYAIGGALSGVSGALLAFNLSYVGYATFSVTASIIIFQMAVIGGLGRIRGSVLGALIIICLPELLRSLQDYREALGGALIIILMIFRPQGLLGAAKITNLIKK